jgi:hypothetical protein
MIYHEDFPPAAKIDVERANKIANEIMAAAQNDCDTVRKESTYQIVVIDRNRKASPLVRRLGPLQPKRSFAISKAAGDLDDDDNDLDSRGLLLKFIKEGLEQSKWDKNRNDRIVNGMLMLQDNIITKLTAANEKLMLQQITFFEKLQDAQDRSLDREVARKREEFKMTLWEDGMRTVRNLLPGLANSAKEQQQLNDTNGASRLPGSNGFAPEKALIDNFLHDCESKNLDIALFGDYEEENGKLKQVKEGIFSFKQFAILIGVRDGGLPPSTLDQLMPDSGHPNAITNEQIEKARAIGVTDGIAMALVELVGLRQRAKMNFEEKEMHP